MMNMNDYYFYVAPDEEGLGWEFTISDLIESEFEARPDYFQNKSAKIEFLKELIADIEECIEKNREGGGGMIREYDTVGVNGNNL